MLAGAEDAASHVDHAASAYSWSDHYQGMSELYADWGDHDNAAWYADHAASAANASNWLHYQGMDTLDT